MRQGSVEPLRPASAAAGSAAARTWQAQPVPLSTVEVGGGVRCVGEFLYLTALQQQTMLAIGLQARYALLKAELHWRRRQRAGVQAGGQAGPGNTLDAVRDADVAYSSIVAATSL